MTIVPADASRAGARGVRRLALVQALNSAGEACLTVSLAGSLFFGVSIDAARPLVLFYLLLTMAPFAVVVPIIGPVVDGIPSGQRTVLSASMALRVGIFALLTMHLDRLAFYPEAFAALVLGKVFVISKAAIVPRLEARSEKLVRANSIVSVAGAVGLALGGAAAAGLLTLGDAPLVLYLGAVLMGVGFVAALTIPPTRSHRRSRAAPLDVRTPALRDGIAAMAALRLFVGFVTFHLAFVLRGSGLPVWQFGAVLAAAAVGGLIGSSIASTLRRIMGESSLVGLALVLPTIAAAPAAIRFHIATVVGVALALGLAATLGRHGFDSLVQRQSADADLGRTFARLETRFQLAWVAGALVAVLARAPGWAGMAGLSVVGGYAFVAYVSDLRLEAASDREAIAESLLVAARLRAMRGARREAVVLAAAAALAAIDQGVELPPGWDGSRLWALRSRAIAADEPPDGNDVDAALSWAAELIEDSESVD